MCVRVSDIRLFFGSQDRVLHRAGLTVFGDAGVLSAHLQRSVGHAGRRCASPGARPAARASCRAPDARRLTELRGAARGDN